MYSSAVTEHKGYKGGSALLSTALSIGVPIAIDLGAKAIKALIERKKKNSTDGGASFLIGGWAYTQDQGMGPFIQLMYELTELDLGDPAAINAIETRLRDEGEQVFNDLPDVTKGIINRYITHASAIMGDYPTGRATVFLSMALIRILDCIRLLYGLADDEDARANYKDAYSIIENNFFLPGVYDEAREVYIGLKKILHNPNNFGSRGVYLDFINFTRGLAKNTDRPWSDGPFNVLPRLRNQLPQRRRPRMPPGAAPPPRPPPSPAGSNASILSPPPPSSPPSPMHMLIDPLGDDDE